VYRDAIKGPAALRLRSEMKKARITRPSRSASARRAAVARKKKEQAKPAALAVPVGPRATPYLSIKGAARAIEFYKKAFDAVEVVRLTAADGRVAHCEIKIGEASILIADEWEGVGVSSPASLGGTPVIIHLDVADVDAIAKQAIDAGARVIFPVADQFYGARSGRLQDPFGHMWLLSMPIEEVSSKRNAQA